jgi:CubicO group peptidase (beta-lactamase class C family)
MKKFFKILALIIVLALVYFYFALYPKFDIVNGFSSKSVASHHFLAHRSQKFTEERDNDVPSMDLASNVVDEDKKTVTSTVYTLKDRTAIYREGLGSVLIPEGSEDDLKTALIPHRNKTAKNLSFPYGNLPQKDTIFANIDYKKLKRALANGFDKAGEDIKKTRSVLVIYKNHIIAEGYKEGFDKNSIFLGWSMTKSVTSAIFGVLEKQGKLNLEQDNLFKEWQNDNRKKITLRNLLNMNSGLEWNEDYNNISDVTEMLFIDPDMSVKQREKPFVGKPNETWNYSSGTTNLLSGYLRSQFDSQQAYLDFWYRELIDKIGMSSMLIETDFSGRFVGSSYGWATARDWAKFGLLYLHNGNWNGEQLLNQSWIDFSKTPTKGSNGIYGGHFWLNSGDEYPDVPKDMYSCNGYQGQYVFIIPSKNLVIVRTGLAKNNGFVVNDFLKHILEAIK